MAMDLVDIRVILSGGKEVAAEADAAAASISKTGDAAKKANEESAASAKKASGAIRKSSGSTITSLKKTTSAMKTVGGSLTKYVTAPILAIGAASVVMGLNFGRAVQMLHTQAGIAKKELPGLEKFFLHVARVTTSSPTDVANSAFRLAGAGLKGQALREATLASNQLAMVGGADPEETAKTVAQIWYNQIEGGKNFKKIVAELNATVGAGDLRLGQLVDALGTGVVSAAKHAGINFNELNATMAVFGDNTNNVSGWAAQWSTGLHFFTSPTEKAAKAMESLGLAPLQLAHTLRFKGQVPFLKELDDALAKVPGGLHGDLANKILGEILPGGRGRIFGVLMEQYDKLEEKQGRIATGYKNWNKILAETKANPQIALQNAWSNIEADLVELGKVIIPTLVPMLKQLSEWVQSAAEWFKHLSPHAKKVVLILAIFAALLGPMLILLAGFVQGMIALGVVMDAVLSPIVLIPLAIVALGVAFYLAYQKVKWFREGVDWVVNAMGGVVNAVSYVIFSFSPLAAAVTMVVGHFHWLKNAFQNVVHWFETSALGRALTAPFRTLVQWAKNAIKIIEGIIGTAKELLELVGLAEGSGAKAGKHYYREFPAQRPGVGPEPGAMSGPALKGMPGTGAKGSNPGEVGGTARALRLHNARIQTSTSTGTAPVTPAPRSESPIHVKVVMPNGKVLAEEVKKAEQDAGARNG